MNLWKIAFLLSSLVLSGCTIVPGLNVRESAPGRGANYRVVEIDAKVVGQLIKQSQSRIPALPESIAGITPQQAVQLYRIGPGDVISVVVWDHPELTNPSGEFRDPVSAGLLVAADGSLFFPHVGLFRVQGLTVAQVRSYLASELSRIIREPQVDVKVAAYRAQRIQVSGEVKQPGVVTIDDTAKGVLEAINERGGLSPLASRRQVLLTRGEITYRIDLGGLLSGRNGVKNPLLMQGDTIHVPDMDQDRIAVLGSVTNSAPVQITQNGLSLIEALAAAGGLDKLSSDDSGVLIFRRGPEVAGAVPTIYALDLGRPEGMLLASEIPLAPRDVVYVKATDFSKYNAVINQLLPTITAVFQLDSLVNR
jgi:polysaccharide export outer membrane protein